MNVIICSSPFNFAFFNIDEAENVIGYKPNQDYYIMGHSLGGTAASMYVEKNYNKVKGIIFLASYSNSNLSNLSISSLTITASNDLVCKEQTVNNNKYKLPPTSYFYEIEGGNHAQFGAYGEQKGDGKASISNQTQVEQTTDIVSTYVNNS